jgi:ATP-binding cassette subfamily B protein
VKYIWKFIGLVAKYRLRTAVFMVVIIFGVTLETSRSYWLKMIIDSLGNNRQGLELYFGIFCISIIGGNLISALSYHLADKVLIPLAREIREKVFQKMMELDFAYHVDKNTGSLISAFRRGDGAVFNIFHNVFRELLAVMISLSVSLFLLFSVSPMMALILVGLFLINMVIIWWLIKRNLGTRRDFNKAEDRVSGVIADSMINYETVKFFAAEKKERQRLGTSFDVWVKALWNFGLTFRIMDITIGTVSGVGILAIMWLALSGSFGVGDLVMVTGLITGFYWQFFNLFFRIRDIAKSTTDLEKYLEILDMETRVKDPKRPVKIEGLKGEIEFDKVGFLYPKNKQMVLREVSLKIKDGESVAFVGRSGAGKTTLIRLLLRFYNVSSGQIKIDGVDIKKMRKSDLRSLMGVVPQEPVMFNNSIEFNLTYGKENAKKDEVREVARKANILEFIEGLPKKWKTEVGERGIKLSGGQKQRLAIARALLADPKILIFDEATSNLDSESEKMIQKALWEVAKKRTVIIIAHRFSTIRNVDKIVVLSNGGVVETGKHEELIKNEGIYAKLWTLQSKGKFTDKAEKLI